MKTLGLLLPTTIVLLLCGAAAADAQPPGRRVEVGVQASFLRLGEFDTTNAGIGGRASFALTGWAALDAEGNFFPSDDVLLPSTGLAPSLRVTYHRRRTDAFLGLRLGMREGRLGVFARVRPGFTRLSEKGGGPECVGPQCALVLLVRPEYGTEFALDLGGGLEFHPSARTVARFDLGDTMIRHRGLAPPCWGTDCTRHYLSSRLGVGVRF